MRKRVDRLGRQYVGASNLSTRSREGGRGVFSGGDSDFKSRFVIKS